MNPSTPLWRFWQGNNKKRIEFTSNTFFFFFLLWKLVGCHSEGVGSIVKKHSWTAHLDGGVLVWMEPRASLNQLRSAHGQWSILFASHGLYFIIKIPVFAFRLELFSGLMNVIFFFFFSATWTIEGSPWRTKCPHRHPCVCPFLSIQTSTFFRFHFAMAQCEELTMKAAPLALSSRSFCSAIRGFQSLLDVSWSSTLSGDWSQSFGREKQFQM